MDAAENGMPKNCGEAVVAARRTAGRRSVGRGMPLMPSGPLVRSDPVDQDDADDLAEAERHDGEIVAAQTQHRKAEQEAPNAASMPASGRQTQNDRPKFSASSA